MVRTDPPPTRLFSAPLMARDLYQPGEVCLKIPTELIAIIVGALHELQYPHAWQGNAEDIALAMRQVNHFIGAWGDIDTHCGTEETECPHPGQDDKDIGVWGGIIETGEMCEMNCSIPYGALRWNNGTLQYKYCGEWFDVTGTREENEITPPPDGWGFDNPSGSLYPCGKAYNLSLALVTLAAYVWDESDNSVPPFFIWGAENAVGFDLKDSYMTELWALTLAHKGLRGISEGVEILERSDVLPEDLLERMSCLLVGHMNASEFEGDGDAIDKSVESVIGAIFPLTSVSSIAAQAWWYVIKAAIGKAMMANLANAGALDNTRVCDCPEIIINNPTEPDENGWYLSALLDERTVPVPHDRGEAYPLDSWGYAFATQELQHDVFGWVCDMALVSGHIGATKRANDHIEAVMGPADVYLCGSNSEADTLPRRYAQMNQAEFDALGLSAQGYIRLAPLGTDGYASYNDPPATSGQQAVFSFSSQVYPVDPDENGVVRIFGIRWLMNTNSPSHQ